MDQTSAAAIRQALAAARTGQLAEACAIAERGLAAGGDPIALNALLGMLRSDLGQPDAAVKNLEIAHAARPRDVRIAANLATALIRTGDLERVLDVATKDLAFSDPSLELARLRGYAANQLGEHSCAIE